WVWTSPLVVIPQIANPPTSNQNVDRRDAVRRTENARCSEPWAGAAGGSWSAGAPYGTVPTSDGRPRRPTRTTTSASSAAAADAVAALRQPNQAFNCDNSGRKIN